MLEKATRFHVKLIVFLVYSPHLFERIKTVMTQMSRKALKRRPVIVLKDQLGPFRYLKTVARDSQILCIFM